MLIVLGGLLFLLMKPITVGRLTEPYKETYMKPAPTWLKTISIATTSIVGTIFYVVGLKDSDDTLIYSGVALIMTGLICAVITWKDNVEE